MENTNYKIKDGDDFYCLAQRYGGTCDDFMQVNPGVDPQKLQIGQVIVLPKFSASKGLEQYADISLVDGHEFVGKNLDEVEMEVDGVRFRVRRIGESKVPHEIHLILPRVEIRKIQPAGELGPSETQIMISNLNIVHSPRLTSGNSTESIAVTQAKKETMSQSQQAPQLQNQQTEVQPQAPF